MRKIALLLFTNIFISAYSQLPEDYLKALVALESNKTEEAIVQFSKCIHSGIEPGKSYYYQGKAYLALKDYQLAELDFSKALELNINESALELAKLYAKLGNTKASIRFLKKYISLNPSKNPNTIINDPDLRSLHNSNDWFDFVADFAPNEKWELVSAINYLLDKKQFREAHDKVDEALVHFQNDASLHALKSNIYLAEGNFTLANYEISLAIKSDSKNIDLLLEAADLAMNSNQFSKATLYLEKANELKPELFNTNLKLAKAYLLSGQYQIAQNEIDYFINLFPENNEAIFQQAEIFYANGKYNATLRAINKLFTEEIIKSEWYLLRGKTYYKTNVLNYAAEDLAMCLDLTPNSIDANYFLGLTQNNLGNKELACYYFNRAYKLGDDRPLNYIQANCTE